MRSHRGRYRSIFTPSPLGMAASYVVLVAWALGVLFPLYWLLVTSFKTPLAVNSGPFYLPFIDFKPTLSNWHYIFLICATTPSGLISIPWLFRYLAPSSPWCLAPPPPTG